MKLSVIIVNYNVKHFLEQCLNSVFESLKNIESEVWVVDNNSVDGSCTMVKDKFPEVRLIENKQNTGFSYANNQALEQSKAEYALLLNPDTIVKEDTFKKCIEFMDSHPDAGGLGVKMVDGNGKFLPESKRALPTPSVSFYKIFGLSSLFPKSKRFSKYHLGFLDKNKTHEVEILAGAFMFMRKSVLDKIGFLDDTFFMYGEDIDLSYRIILGGYKNYYYPETQILHYKGESTKKGSLNYVLVFYNAMIIFAKKHFSKKNANIYSFIIKLAIFFRAFVAILHRIVKKTIVPFSDALMTYSGFLLSSIIWQKISGHNYSELFHFVILPIYSLFTVLIYYFSGVYDKSKSLKNLFRGIYSGIIGLVFLYAFLPENLRFSRAVIVLGSVWLLIFLPLYRLVLSSIGIKIFNILKPKRKNIGIIGNNTEIKNITEIIEKNTKEIDTIFKISSSKEFDKPFIGNINQLEEIIKINRINELIFSADSLSSQEIIELMLEHEYLNVEFKIAPHGSQTVIGSNSINSLNDLFYLSLNSIENEKNQRIKRTTDILLFFVSILLSPYLIVFKFKIFKESFLVLFNKKTWVGYNSDESTENLPKLKPGVFKTSEIRQLKNKSISDANLIYAKDYHFENDFLTYFRHFFV